MKMLLFSGLAVLLAILPGVAAAAPCKGKLSGAVSAEFDCTVMVRYRAEKDVTHFMVNVAALPAGVKTFAPAAFDITGKPKAGKLDLPALGRGASVLTTTEDKSFMAAKTPKLGKLEIELKTVAEPAAAGREHAVTGSITGELAEPVGDKKVKLEVTF